MQSQSLLEQHAVIWLASFHTPAWTQHGIHLLQMPDGDVLTQLLCQQPEVSRCQDSSRYSCGSLIFHFPFHLFLFLFVADLIPQMLVP